MSQSTGVYNLQINQYATYQKTFIWIGGGCGCGTVGATPGPIDLTGYTANMQFRAFPSPTAPLLYDASADITLGGTAGTIALLIDSTDTAGFGFYDAAYDLILASPAGVVTRLLMGKVTVAPGVTP